MADYYPQINQAVSRLKENNEATRAQLYERARNTLKRELRGLAANVATRELLQLEEAFRRVEEAHSIINYAGAGLATLPGTAIAANLPGTAFAAPYPPLSYFDPFLEPNSEQKLSLRFWTEVNQKIEDSHTEPSNPEAAEKWRALTPRLTQEEYGAQFELAGDGVLTFVDLGGQNDREVAADGTTRRLQAEIQRKSIVLHERAIRLSNHPSWGSLVQAADLFSKAVNRSPDETADEIATIWSLSVSLGGYMEQDEHARANPKGMIDELEAVIVRRLRDLITRAAPWIRRFPTARLLDDEARTFSYNESTIDPASSFLRRVWEAALIRDNEAKVVAVALNSGKVDAAIAGKARGWGIRSMRNAGLAILAIAGTAAAGYSQEIGTEIAKNSQVAQRIERFVVDSEHELLDLLSHLPSDIRGALKSAVDALKKNTTM